MLPLRGTRKKHAGDLLVLFLKTACNSIIISKFSNEIFYYSIKKHIDKSDKRCLKPTKYYVNKIKT